MRILQFVAENFKRIRIVEIVPTKRVTKLTGKNGQGKTSVLDAMWALFAGKRGIPDKPVRQGATKSRLRAVIGDDDGKPLLIATRTIAADRTTTLTVEAAPGREALVGTPQAVLDTLTGQMSFDPIAFIRADAKTQVETLRTLVKVDIDLEEENRQIEIAYNERRELRKEAEKLRAQATAMSYSPNLPKEKLDEEAIMAHISEAAAHNRSQEITGAIQRHLDASNARVEAERAMQQNESTITQLSERAALLRRDLEQAEKGLEAAAARKIELAHCFHAADEALARTPYPQPIDTQPLLEQLERARLVNREIDRRTRWEELDKQASETQRQADERTRSIEDREEKKRAALAGAKMPIAGLSFNEEGVSYNGIPLLQLGEAEQIRIGVALAMAANPKLRAVPIARGESLDDDALAMIDQMAEEQNFQIFMARVDSSGKVGIVLSDGKVESVNE